jgi:hypothetical protein
MRTEDLTRIAEKFGPTASVFSLAHKRGIGFVSFYDSRDAEKCVNELESKIIHGKTVHTAYAYTPPDRSPHNAKDNCATITVQVPSGEEAITDGLIGEVFGRYGDIKIVTKQDDGTSFTVKYYDVRAARKAVEESGTVEVSGAKSTVELNFRDDDDLQSVPKEEDLEIKRSKLREAPRDFRRDGGRPPERRSHDGHHSDYKQRPGPEYPPPGYPPPFAYPGYPGFPCPPGYMPMGYPMVPGFMPPPGYPPMGFFPPEYAAQWNSGEANPTQEQAAGEPPAPPPPDPAPAKDPEPENVQEYMELTRLFS